MEHYINETTGLITVALGGAIWDNCTRDVDCPGRAICATNTTWLSASAMCICPTEYGLIGAQCNTLSSWSYVFVVGHILACIVSSFGVFIGLHNMYRLWSAQILKLDTIATSVFFSICALTCTAVQTGSSLRYALSDPPILDDGRKLDESWIGRLSAAGSFAFSIICMVSISMAWIEVAETAQNASAMRPKIISNVRKIKCILLTVFSVIIVLLTVTLSLLHYVLVTAVSVPAIILLIGTYILGYFRIQRSLNEYTTTQGISESKVGGSTGRTAVQIIQESVRSIKLASISLSTSALGFAVFLVTWLAVGGFSARPGQWFSLVAISLVWMFVATGNITIASYLWVVVLRKVRAARRPRTQTKSPRTNNLVEKKKLEPEDGAVPIIASMRDSGNRSSKDVYPE